MPSELTEHGAEGEERPDALDEVLADLERETPGATLTVRAMNAHATAATALRKMRKQLGLTQKALAGLAYVKRSLVARYENPDYVGHKVGNLERLAAAADWTLELRIRPKGEHALVLQQRRLRTTVTVDESVTTVFTGGDVYDASTEFEISSFELSQSGE